VTANWASDGTLNIRPDRTVSLDDVGGGGYHLAFAAGPDGAVTFLLRDAASSEDTNVVLDIHEWPRHERLGPLQQRDWRRCLTVLYDRPRNRCRRPTRHGDPCLALVGAPGRACPHHHDAAESR
jgi:hypothetical protein